ncbi:hypothetical protein CI238_11252, partial [Colletotrichum incanum]
MHIFQSKAKFMPSTTTMVSDTKHPLVPDLSKYPKLSREQAGHLRHCHNPVSQPDNDWYFMGSQEPWQKFLDAYLYQLSMIAYVARCSYALCGHIGLPPVWLALLLIRTWNHCGSLELMPSSKKGSCTAATY